MKVVSSKNVLTNFMAALLIVGYLLMWLVAIVGRVLDHLHAPAWIQVIVWTLLGLLAIACLLYLIVTDDPNRGDGEQGQAAIDLGIDLKPNVCRGCGAHPISEWCGPDCHSQHTSDCPIERPKPGMPSKTTWALVKEATRRFWAFLCEITK